ncbi:MAG: MFS transporter [Streptomycetaceae bacterium]|nr:MAG: MFS transporter [Streptomycetaceae bacterium]
MKTTDTSRELNYLKALFFLFGFLIMSWLPRFPEVKVNLGLSNGAFGSLMSLSAVGSLISLLTVGHLVHNFGAKLVLRTAATSMAVSLILLTSTRSALVFFISNVLQGASIAAFHVSINAQGFNFQDRTKRHVVTLLSGFWSGGALITAVISGVLVDRISLSRHISSLAIMVLILMLFIITAIGGNLLKPSKSLESDFKISDLLKSFRIDGVISGVLFCAGLLELSVGDWASIFLKEDIGIKGGLNTLPYILFTFAMITGRLNVHRLFVRFSILNLVKVASLTSGTCFLAGILSLKIIGVENKALALGILSLSFFMAGLGSSFLSPSVMNAANMRSKSPSSVVVAQLSLINNLAAFLMRLVIAWTAQALSLSTALLIPALIVLMVPFFSKVFKNV